MEILKSTGSPENRVAGLLPELAIDLSKHSFGRLIYFGLGLFFIYCAIYGAIRGEEGWPDLLIIGCLPWAFALWGWWQERREERREGRSSWRLVWAFAGVVLILGVLAFVLLRRRRPGTSLPELTPAEVDRLTQSEASS